jgi:hypothetical protein
MKKLSEQHWLIQSAVKNNTGIKYLVFLVGIFLPLLLSPWDNPFKITTLVLGEFFIGLCMILSNTYFIQYDYPRKKEESQLNQAINPEHEVIALPAPSFNFLLLRHSLSYLGIISVFALLWGGLVFGLSPWITAMLSDAPEGTRNYATMRSIVFIASTMISLVLRKCS